MNQGMANTVVSAIVGGIVGAGVVFFAGGKVDLKNVELEELKVAKLTITEQASLLNKEGNPEVMIREGSILAENVILGKKMIAQQMQGHAIVTNRLLATPDNLLNVPMENWRFYAEIGASLESGGEIVVRNLQGPAMINKPISGGAFLRMGYDPEQRPQMFALHNATRSPLGISQELSETQRQMISTAMANPQGVMPPSSFDSTNGTTPLYQGAGATSGTTW